jgi:hypothetical protein
LFIQVLILRAKLRCICLGTRCCLDLLFSGSRSSWCAHALFWNKVQVCVVQVITGTVNTTFSENQAKYLDVPESNEPQYDHSEDKAQINYSTSAEERRPWTEPSKFAAGVVANALKKNLKVDTGVELTLFSLGLQLRSCLMLSW